MEVTHKLHSSQWVRKECIGRGSFGRVHVAVDSSNHQIFAVKSVNAKTSPAPHLQALENEIQILQTISSPYVVGYLGNDLSRESSQVYRNLHMEYMPGGTVAECGGRGEETVRGYTRCIASALQYLHCRGIVHCDVKGQNVLVGSDGIAKLADFGSAKRLSEEKKKIVYRGTPLWMAPEVIRGEKQGTESDIWSLGCTLIEMFTGKPAWKDGESTVMFTIGFSDQVPEFPAQLSELGRDFLEKCLRREPSERWTSEQLLQHPFVRDVVVYSSPVSVLDRSNAEFSQEQENEISNYGVNDPISNFDVKGVIGLLASTRGAIWESEGWEEVRCRDEIHQEEEEEEDTSLEYSDSSEVGQERERVEVEIEERGLEYSIMSGGWRASRLGNCDSGAGLGCQHGLVKKSSVVMVVVKKKNNCYSCCCLVCCCSSLLLSAVTNLIKYRVCLVGYSRLSMVMLFDICFNCTEIKIDHNENHLFVCEIFLRVKVKFSDFL